MFASKPRVIESPETSIDSASEAACAMRAASTKSRARRSIVGVPTTSPSGAAKGMLQKMADTAEVDLETTPDESDARDWSLVLAAAGVPARVEQRASGWAILVANGDLGRARAALAAYLADAVASRAPEFEYGPTKAGLAMAAALVAITPFTGFRGDGRAIFHAGEGVAVRILAGEPWRTVTALMLHADATHLLGNVVGMGVLATAVCRLLGPGLGLALIVLSGAAGNFLNAALRGAPHVSVGASTAIFGALGILAGSRHAARAPAARACLGAVCSRLGVARLPRHGRACRPRGTFPRLSGRHRARDGLGRGLPRAAGPARAALARGHHACRRSPDRGCWRSRRFHGGRACTRRYASIARGTSPG